MIREEIQISGSAGKPILLDYTYRSIGAEKTIIIFSHGFKGFKDWGHFNAVAEYFANAGYFFIKFNYSHNGTTPQDPHNFGDLDAFGNNNFSIELDDLGLVIDWIQKETRFEAIVDLDHICLIGHSRGGGVSVLKAEEDPRIDKLVTWAAVSDFESRLSVADVALWKRDGVMYIENARTSQQMPWFIQFYNDYQENKERFFIERAAKNLFAPYLIVHGDRDETVGIEEAQKLNEWCATSELLIIQDGGHTFDAVHPHEGPLSASVLEVLDATDRFLKIENES